jgi:hypothetical protein
MIRPAAAPVSGVKKRDFMQTEHQPTPGGCARARSSLRGSRNTLEFGAAGCYIWRMQASRGWMLRITGPILG